jgi:hypothetical protein
MGFPSMHYPHLGKRDKTIPKKGKTVANLAKEFVAN